MAAKAKKMALKITLKPGEKIIISGAVITNGKTTCHLLLENTVPILREKDILTEKNLSPASRIYYAIQLMYLDPKNLTIYHASYWNHAKDFLRAAPSSLNLIDAISHLVLSGFYYKALKKARELIELEQSILKRI